MSVKCHQCGCSAAFNRARIGGGIMVHYCNSCAMVTAPYPYDNKINWDQMKGTN